MESKLTIEIKIKVKAIVKLKNRKITTRIVEIKASSLNHFLPSINSSLHK